MRWNGLPEVLQQCDKGTLDEIVHALQDVFEAHTVFRIESLFSMYRRQLEETVGSLYRVLENTSPSSFSKMDKPTCLERFKTVICKSMMKQELAKQRQHDNDRNAFAVVWGAGKISFVARKQTAQTARAGVGRARVCTGLLAVDDDALGCVLAFLALPKIELQHEWKAAETLTSCQFSPCGKAILTCSARALCLWDAVNGGLEHELDGGHSAAITSSHFSPNGTTVVSALDDGTLKVWDVKSGKLGKSLEGHTHWVSSIGVSPDSARILSLCSDGALKLWSSATGELEHSEQMDGTPSCCSFSPGGGEFLLGFIHCGLKLYDSTTFQHQRTFNGHTSEILSCSFAPDRPVILSCSLDGTIKMWNTTTGRLLRTLDGYDGAVHSCAFSPNGLTIASASESALRLWTAATGCLQQIVATNSCEATSCCFSKNGKTILCGYYDGTVRTWHVEGQSPKASS
jgi:hypothetical protein